MSVQLTTICVQSSRTVLTLMADTPVIVDLDSKEMDSLVQVIYSKYKYLHVFQSIINHVIASRHTLEFL